MIRAVIFDMDGVLSDTQNLAAEVESAVLQIYGVKMAPEEITRKYAGVLDAEFFLELFATHKINSDVGEAAEKKWEAMRERTKSGVPAISGAIELVELLSKHGLKLAVASSSPPAFIKYVLSSLGIQGKFVVVTSSEEVRHGKPSPDVFLLAAERLGVLPQECVVIEDGINGMTGAKKAGMKCIGLVEDKTGEYPADVLVASLSEITTELIKGFLHERTKT